jgi:hypothetical protein
MLRRRRVALAATASSVLVAGALTAAALTVTSGTARAAAADQCYGSGSPVSCGWTANDPVTVDYPTSLGLWATTTPAGLTVTLTYDVTCINTSGTASTGLKTTTSTGSPVTITIPDTAPSFCTVAATATVPGTYATGSSPTPTTTATATPTPTATLTEAALNFQVDATSSATASPTATTTTSSPTTYSNLVTGFGNMCMDDTAHSSAERTAVSIWRCNDTDPAQNFSYWGSELRTNGLCVNVKGNGKSGSKLILWQCNGAANEIFIRKGSEWVEKADNYKLCIDDPAYSTRGGTQLMVYTCNNGSNQHWSKP